MVKVKGRHVNDDGQAVVKCNSNFTLDSILYDLLSPSGAVNKYAANKIAETLYFTLDSDGHSKAVLDCILEHSKENRYIDKAERYVHTKKGNRGLWKMTIGWNILVWWNNETDS